MDAMTRHPTPDEIGDWYRGLESGFARKGMLLALIDAYADAWHVICAARRAIVKVPEGFQVRDMRGNWVDGEGSYLVVSDEFERLEELEQTLEAFDGVGTEPEQLELGQ